MHVLDICVIIQFTLSDVTIEYVEGEIFLTPATSPGDRFGNNVSRRGAYLPTGANKSWLDSEAHLPVGTLDKFYFYIHPNTTAESSKIFLQIWRPAMGSANMYVLVWQKHIHVMALFSEFPNGVLAKVSIF